MTSKESLKRARANYKKKVEELRVELYPTDEDIKTHLDELVATGGKKAAYIKQLIRQDIEAQKAKG